MNFSVPHAREDQVGLTTGLVGRSRVSRGLTGLCMRGARRRQSEPDDRGQQRERRGATPDDACDQAPPQSHHTDHADQGDQPDENHFLRLQARAS
jgi:hypothetical protein